ncbi:substrate-binding periplasmic protein [Kordiimonas gwangyangensis]|uniref:substrate-binding periplasmic protein n=1 Tax=Kordiimonas gwangyangensis TaxID=288022 RepID=UPI00037363B6|nr:transporter substrate-binding domain-containing protein [Kordiimonas gwangyangensis]
MRNWLPWLVVLTLLGFGSVSAQESKSFPQPVTKPKAFVVGTILHNPPYVTEHPSSGIDLDIIRAAMARSGVEVRFVHAPIARVEKLLENGSVDAITTFSTVGGLCENSDVFSEWHDGIIVPRDSNAAIRSASDLAGLKVGLFPGAEQVLATTLDPHVSSFGGKVTIFSAPLVLRMLRYNRIDAYIGDYWSIEYAQKNDLEFKNQPRLFDVAVKFPPTPRSLCIRDKEHLAMFNEGFAAAKAAGLVSGILSQYRAFIPD